MGAARSTICMLLAVSILALAACGGAGSIMDTQQAGEVPETLATNDSGGSGFTGVPEIPLDEGEPDRSSSAAGDGSGGIGYSVVLGKDYLQMWGGYVDGTALVIGANAPGAPDPAGDPDDGTCPNVLPSYGLYKVSGLLQKRPLSLNIECVPGGMGENYYVGVADYTEGTWRWFGPVNLPEFELDLRNVRSQFVTHIGNMYFILVCATGNSATHYKTTVIYGEHDPGGMPGFPHHLVASDGQLPEAVGLTWVAGNGAALYQIFRKAARPDAEWEMIGTTKEHNYMDAPLPDYKLFCYRVRAVNAAGQSCWSNMDTGFAGGGADPCVIKGDITTVGSEPVPGIAVALVGLGEQMVRRTDEEGRFYFGDLPSGKYIVAPYHAELEFYPPYHAVDLTEERIADIHFNCAPTWVFHRVWGFAFTFDDDSADCYRFEPMEGVDVRCRKVGDPNSAWTAETNEHGFWLITDLPEGVYLATAQEEGYGFFPPVHEVVVNGHNRPDRCDFLGIPSDGDG